MSADVHRLSAEGLRLHARPTSTWRGLNDAMEPLLEGAAAP
ncbi:hypothetical protein ACQP2P_31010 [Dactylosporangium sp. CA-139114]